MSATNCRIVLLAALLMNAAVLAAEQTQVSGRVVDRKAGGAGLPGAEVSIFLQRRDDPNPIAVCESPDRTDQEGRFRFPCELQREPVELHVSRPAYIPDPYRVRMRMTRGETRLNGVPPFDGIPLSPVKNTQASFERAAQELATKVVNGASSVEGAVAAVRRLNLRPDEEQAFLDALEKAVRERQGTLTAGGADPDEESHADTDVLPSTGSAVALLGGLGLGALAAAFALRRGRRHH